MEIQELKALWQADSQRLEKRIELNEKLLKQMNMEKAVGQFDILIKRSIQGRNMAMVYGIISLISASLILNRLEFSIPIILAGIAMFWSFKHHLSISKPTDYHKLSLIELQKSICNFRIHTASSAKYDIAIMFAWFLTLIPPLVQFVFKVSIYENGVYGIAFLLGTAALAGLSNEGVKKIYKEYEVSLTQSETYLEELIDFEKI